MSDAGIVDRAKTALKNAVGKGKPPWTPRAQAVLKRAQKQARREGADQMGSEHILFGIVSVKDCLGATILKNLGVEPTKCVDLYEESCASSDNKGSGRADLAEDVDKVIQCAQEQSAAWGHEYIGAEHLLVGILLAGEGAGFRMLTDLGVTLEKVREETKRLIVCNNVKNERIEK